MNKFTQNDLNEFVLEMKRKEYGPSSINKNIALLKGALNFAKDNGDIENIKLNFPNFSSKTRTTFWTKLEVEKFLSSAKKCHFYNLYIVALNTGMRKGELLALTWDKIDFLRGLILVNDSLDSKKRVVPTKGRKETWLPLNDVALTALKKQRELSQCDVVFTEANKSTFMYPSHLNKYFNNVVASAGIKKIRFHDLRHTFASHFVMNGGNLYTLKTLLTHSSVTTSERYAHLAPDYLRDAVSLVKF